MRRGFLYATGRKTFFLKPYPPLRRWRKVGRQLVLLYHKLILRVETVFETPVREPRRVEGPMQPLVVHKSKRNIFGIVRTYRLLRGSSLTHDPDGVCTLMDLTDSASKPTVGQPNLPSTSQFGPFPNKSAFSLADWYWNSSRKSFKDFQQLITLFKQRDFRLSDTLSLDWRAAFRALGANREDVPDDEGGWIHDDGWKTTAITIDVPLHHRTRNPGYDTYTAGSFHHRSIVSVIKERISNPKDNPLFHYQPYQATWKPNDMDATPELELHGELYCSRAFRDANEKVQALPVTERNEGLERVVVGMMFWTDGTQLTSFGGASLWPCYMFFGNESKYRRSQPSNHLGEQVAYFMKVRSC